jgi:hypothetical protein
MTNTFLISEAKLRQFTDINDNVDTELLKNAVRVGQDIELQRVIGTNLYQSLLTQVDAGPVWTTPNYETLVNGYIQDFLLYAAYYEALEAIYLRPRNNGLLTPTGGENSVNADRSLYDMKRQSVNNKMQYYGERLSNYIAEEQALFPELNSANKIYEQWPDYGIQYRSPVAFKYQNRAAHYQQAKEAGLRIADSKYKQFPFGSDINNL